MRILIATGGAPHSDTAVLLGGCVQQLSGGTLALLTIITHERERPQAEAILVRARTLLAAPHDGIETLIYTGKRAETIVREAAAGNYDLLVIGERIEEGLRSRLLPPTVEKVVEVMPCPVLIARGQPRPPRRVLVCEGGRDPDLLIRLIAHLAPLLKQANELAVLHVMSQIAAAPGVPDWELQAAAEELIQRHTPEGSLLEEDLARLAQLNVRLEAKVRHGLVVREILDEAQSGAYDLVVIGAHRGEGWERYLLDNLAREIMLHVDRPVLIV